MERRTLNRAVNYEISFLYTVPSEAGKGVKESLLAVGSVPILTPLVVDRIADVPEIMLDCLNVCHEGV